MKLKKKLERGLKNQENFKIMRDKTHTEHIERWARYVKENPDTWKEKLKPFLDSQILIARRAYKELGKTEEGREKIERLRKLTEDKDIISQIVVSEKNIKKAR